MLQVAPMKTRVTIRLPDILPSHFQREVSMSAVSSSSV